MCTATGPLERRSRPRTSRAPASSPQLSPTPLEFSHATRQDAEKKLERSKRVAVEAKQAWLVALAKVEVAKSDAAGVTTDDAKANHEELTKQLAEAEADHAAAKEKLVAVDQAVSEAQDDVNKAKSDN
jgi:hypothetical protein